MLSLRLGSVECEDTATDSSESRHPTGLIGSRWLRRRRAFAIDLRYLLAAQDTLPLEGEPQSGLVLPLRVMGVDGSDRPVGSWAGIHIGIRKAKLRMIERIE